MNLPIMKKSNMKEITQIEIRIKLMLLTKINDKIRLSYCKRKFCILLIKKFLFPKKKKNKTR